MSNRPFIYICSPYSGDIETNTEKAQKYCRQIFDAGYTPIAPHLLFPQFLDDNVYAERIAGMKMGEKLLMQCSALVICGNTISNGMKQEIEFAQRFRISAISLDTFQIEANHLFSKKLSMLTMAIEAKPSIKERIKETKSKLKIQKKPTENELSKSQK